MESCFEILMPSFSVQHPESHDRTGMELCFNRSDSSGSFVSIDDSIEWEEEGEGEGEGIEKGEQPVIDAESTAQKNGTEDDRNGTEDDWDGTEDESDSEIEWEEVGTSSDRGFDAHGMIGTGWNVTFELPNTVQVLEEHNQGLIEVLRERHRLLTGKYLRTIGKWMEVSVVV